MIAVSGRGPPVRMGVHNSEASSKSETRHAVQGLHDTSIGEDRPIVVLPLSVEINLFF